MWDSDFLDIRHLDNLDVKQLLIERSRNLYQFLVLVEYIGRQSYPELSSEILSR